ncbi:carboxypeptidase-like regulatory domain-containing protein [Bremerella sp.]|uniref:carboxypeptidase-like regulatory domain-containing protein n=1 Tax=Bremerella sp. TaxID=2795602 RepID=UPI00391DCF4F
MQMQYISAALLLFTATFLGLLGCSGNGGATEAVTGTVTFEDGSPVSGGTIIFADTKKNSSSVGYIQDDGTYTLGTFAETDGAPQGNYKVTIIGNSDYGKSSPISSKFANQDQTPLNAEVVDGANVLDFQVEKGR